jgi:hypothetical protein
MNYINDSGLEQFHQLKKEIRGSTEYLVVGVDIAKDKHSAITAAFPGTL